MSADFMSSDSICGEYGSPCCSDRYAILVILERILTWSRSDTGDEKKKLCIELGAEKWIDFKEAKDIVQAVREACGGEGAHCAVVTTASGSGYTQAVDYLRPGGTLMAVGLPGEAKLEASIFFTVFKVGLVKKDCGFAYSGIGTEYQHHWFICW
jgi:D-arabinose 1-dehydrogenase-like Zn-dependent alcohol dehydrogenase